MDLNHDSFFEEEEVKYIDKALKNQICRIENVITLDKGGQPIINKFDDRVVKIVLKIIEGDHKGEVSTQELKTDISTGNDGTVYKPLMLRNLILNTGFYLEEEEGKRIIPDEWATEIKGKLIVVDFKKSNSGFIKIERTREIEG